MKNKNIKWKKGCGEFKVNVNDGYCEWEYVIELGGKMSIYDIVEKIGGKVISQEQIKDAYCPFRSEEPTTVEEAIENTFPSKESVPTVKWVTEDEIAEAWEYDIPNTTDNINELLNRKYPYGPLVIKVAERPMYPDAFIVSFVREDYWAGGEGIYTGDKYVELPDLREEGDTDNDC